MQCNDYKLDPCRDKVFDRLCEIWTETKESKDPSTKKAWDDDIWRKANTLQTVAQYWTTTTDATRRGNAMNIMKDGYEFYKKFLESGRNIWVDDFGWWFGFFGDLVRYDGKLPSPFDPANLLSEAKYCYERMLVNLDKTKGGIWNHTDGEDGEKNTVTNAWMLNVASGLSIWTGELKYKNMAEAQYKWLTSGKYESYSPPSWFLYRKPYKLLLWLPGTTNTGNYWAGDEGVFLRGLIWYIDYVANPNDRIALLANSQALIVRALGPTQDFSSPDAWRGFPDKEAVMHESPDPNAWNNDLATGKGVFMRLVTRFACHYKFFNDASVRKIVEGFVNSTAESVWCSCDKTTGTTAANWNPRFGPRQEGEQPTSGDLWPQVLQTDGLDALNAAVQIRAAA